MPGQGLLPVPHLVAALGLQAKLVRQSNFYDAVYIAQTFLKLKIGVLLQAARHGGQDLGLVQPGAAGAAHCHDKWPVEFGAVIGVELLDGGQLLGRAVGQAGFFLLVARLGRQLARHQAFAREFGVGAQKRQLRLAAGTIQHLCHGVLQLRQRFEGPLGQRLVRDPVRMLVQAGQHGMRLGQRRAVEFV